MKKIISVILTFALLFCAAGCAGTGAEGENAGSPEDAGPVEQAGGEPAGRDIGEAETEKVWFSSAENVYPLEANCEVRFAAVNGNTVFAAGIIEDKPRLAMLALKTASDGSCQFGDPISIPLESTEPDEQYIYGLAAGTDDLFYLLMGEKPDTYTFVGGNYETIINPDYQGLYSVVRYHADGSKDGKISFQLSPLDGVLGAKCLYGLVCGENGELIAWGNSEVSLLRWDGGFIHREAMTPNSIDAVSRYKDKVVVLSGINGTSGCMGIDAVSGELYPIAEGSNAYTSSSSCLSYSGRLLTNDWSSLYEYDPETGSLEELFNWTECGGLEGGSIKQVAEIAENVFLISYWHNDCFTVVQRRYVQDSRQVLKMACYPNISRSMAKTVGEFNSSNSEYRVEYTDYGADGEERLLAELSSRNSPDLLLTDGTIETSSDVFSDLYPFIDKSEKLTRESFVPGLLNALAPRGELHDIWTSFYLNTFLARSTGAKDTENSFEYYEAVAAERGEDVSVFGSSMTRDELLKWVAAISTGQYVDRVNGTCRFDDPSFSDLLARCKSLPVQGTNTGGDLDTAILFPQYIENPAVIESWTEMLGGSIEYAGFPVEEGNGGYLSCGYMSDLAIPSGGNINGAWAFIEYALLAEGQRNIDADIYSMKFSTLQAPLEQALFKAMDSASAKKFIDAVNHTDRIMTHYDETLREIIIESCAAYFSGDKSLDETVDLIQSRANIYVQERLG